MRKALKFFSVILSALVLLAIVATLAFYHLIHAGELRRFLISEIEAKTEFKVQLGETDLELGRILGIAFERLCALRTRCPPARHHRPADYRTGSLVAAVRAQGGFVRSTLA